MLAKFEDLLNFLPQLLYLQVYIDLKCYPPSLISLVTELTRFDTPPPTEALTGDGGGSAAGGRAAAVEAWHSLSRNGERPRATDDQ